MIEKIEIKGIINCKASCCNGKEGVTVIVKKNGVTILRGHTYIRNDGKYITHIIPTIYDPYAGIGG